MFKEKPTLRFKNFSYPWKRKTLYSLTNVKSSSRSASEYKDDYKVGNYPVFDIQGEIARVDNYDSDKEYIAIIKDGASVGKSFLLPGKSSVIGTMSYLYNSTEIDLAFLYYIISTKINWKKHIVGSTIPHIYYKDYSLEKLYIPEFEEQKYIGAFFQDLVNLQ